MNKIQRMAVELLSAIALYPDTRRRHVEDGKVRAIICGSRSYSDEVIAFLALDLLNSFLKISCVIEGGATGADTIARQWAQSRGISVETHSAAWNQFGKKAGYLRNMRMIRRSPDCVIAFPGGHGTEMMKGIARRFAVPVLDLTDVEAIR
jgi:hypothetical protein